MVLTLGRDKMLSAVKLYLEERNVTGSLIVSRALFGTRFFIPISMSWILRDSRRGITLFFGRDLDTLRICPHTSAAFC